MGVLLIWMVMKTMVCTPYLRNWARLTISGYDDVIYPVDYRVAGHIVDDDMHAIMYVVPCRWFACS